MATNQESKMAALIAAIADGDATDGASYESLWHQYWDGLGVAGTNFNERMLNWINTALSASHTVLPSAMQAYAEYAGAYNWDSLADVIPGIGVELVVNGGFDTDTTGWTNANESFATIASVAGQLVVTSINSATGGKIAYQTVAVVPGATYTFSYNFVSETTAGYITLGDTFNMGDYATVVSVGSGSTSFQPAGNVVWVVLALGATQASGSTAVFDDISIVRTA